MEFSPGDRRIEAPYGVSLDRQTGTFSALRIDAVAVPQGAGLIGMTMCPGLKYGSLFAGAEDRSLDADLAAISRWGAVALVSLMEAGELDEYGVAALPERAMGLGLRHYHLPIEDMHVPDPRFERAWDETGATLRALLTDGQRIVLHCLAGLGRTGTIAARLLVELGMDPDAAIRAVRDARPGTIQTFVQERYVLSCGKR